MKYMKTVLILEHEEKVFEKLSCDLCGSLSNGDENWAKGNYHHATSMVQIEERESYPDGGHLKETVFHICDQCFNKKLIPWLESQGAKPTIAESDW
jgi:hypothetical protein